jgi:HemY protein
MLRALWFFTKLAAFTATLIWVIDRPGTVEIEWLGYIVETSTGVVIAALAVVFFIWTQAYRVWRAFVNVPQVYRRYKIAAAREQGYRAVTQGLVAVAAGDAAAAEKLAHRAQSMIPQAPLVKLLAAQSYLMNGQTPRARRAFAELLDDSDAAFFGLRGLLTEHLRDRNYGEALILMRRAAELQPKRVWVQKTLFGLEARCREWIRAETVLKKAEKLSAFDAATARRHRQALLLARAEDAIAAGRERDAENLSDKAFSIDPGFTPASLHLASIRKKRGRVKQAMKAVEKAWRAHPHPALAELWLSLQPPARGRAASIYDHGRDAYKWMEQLTADNPEHRQSHLALGTVALDQRLWVQAREHLTAAMAYKLLARLETDESGRDDRARAWLEKSEGQDDNHQWICSACRHATPEWSPLCPACGAFNEQDWSVPAQGGHDMVYIAPTRHEIGGAMIEPPAA